MAACLQQTLSMTFETMSAAKKSPHRHARGETCFDAVFAVFNDKTALRRNIQFLGRIEKNIRCGLSMRHKVGGIDMGRDKIEQINALHLAMKKFRA